MSKINKALSLTGDENNNIKKSDSSVKRRSKGEKTREKILLATISVLAQKGIKGTTHRAIAAQADLQLSLTTYYFKDIQELVQQAFTLNCQNTSTSSHHLLASSFALIESADKKELRKATAKEALCDELTLNICSQIMKRIEHQAEQLLVEQFMFNEAQVTPALKALVSKHKAALMLPFEHLCQYFNKTDPQLDAQVMFTYIAQLQYNQVTADKVLVLSDIEPAIRKLLAWIMKLK